MKTPQTFFAQLFLDFAWIPSLIIIALVGLGLGYYVGVVDDSLGPGWPCLAIAGGIAAVLAGNIIFNPEMRAKRGLGPF